MLAEHGGQVNAVAAGAQGPSAMARRAAADAMSRFGKKWRLHVLWCLADRPQRFNELLKTDDNMSSFMLAQTLRELELDGLVIRKIIASRPPCTAYQVSAVGGHLLESLTPLVDWVTKNGREDAPGQPGHSP